MNENQLLGDAQTCIRENVKLVHMVCHQFQRRLDIAKIDYEDAFQEGCEALYKAYLRYDGRGKFSTVAVTYIKNHLGHLVYLAGMKKREIYNRLVPINTVIKKSKDEDLTVEGLLGCEPDWTVLELRDFYHQLNKVEKEILRLLLNGYTSPMIAQRFGQSRQNITRIVGEIRELLAEYRGVPVPRIRKAAKRKTS